MINRKQLQPEINTEYARLTGRRSIYIECSVWAVVIVLFVAGWVTAQETYEVEGSITIGTQSITITGGELTLTKKVIGDDDDDDDDGPPPPPNGIYVDAEGSDQANGTPAQPVATVSRALALAADGSAIFLQRGDTFAEKVWLDKRTGIKISAYGTGAAPIINGAKFREGIKAGYTQFEGLVQYRESADCSIDHVQIVNAPYGGVYVQDSKNITVNRCTITDCRAWGTFSYITVPFFREGGRNQSVTISNNDVHRVCTAILETGKPGSGGELISFGHTSGCYVYGNHCSGNAKEGLTFNTTASDIEVHHNYLHDPDKTVYDKIQAGACVYVDGATDAKVWSNVFVGDRSGVAIGSERGHDIDGITIENNLFIRQRNPLVVINFRRGAKIKNIKAIHNHFLGLPGQYAVYQQHTDPSQVSLEVRGNILERSTASSEVLLLDLAKNAQVDRNLFWNAGQPVRGQTGTNAITADPGFSTAVLDGWPSTMIVGANDRIVQVPGNKYTPTSTERVARQGNVTQDISGKDRKPKTMYGAFD